MEKNLKKLPTFVIDKIFTYYYSPQPTKLLEDIKSYSRTLPEITKIYNNFWIKFWPTDLMPPAPGQDNDWLINDIFAYANKEIAIMHGYTYDFYAIWINYLIKGVWDKMNLQAPKYYNMSKKPIHDNKYKTYIDSFISILEKKNSETQIRIFWGAFTPAQREEFLEQKRKQIKSSLWD